MVSAKPKENIEDMSIAGGEDLFEFFAKIGKELNRMRFAKAVFMGKERWNFLITCMNIALTRWIGPLVRY